MKVNGHKLLVRGVRQLLFPAVELWRIGCDDEKYSVPKSSLGQINYGKSQHIYLFLPSTRSTFEFIIYLIFKICGVLKLF